MAGDIRVKQKSIYQAGIKQLADWGRDLDAWDEFCGSLFIEWWGSELIGGHEVMLQVCHSFFLGAEYDLVHFSSNINKL